MSKSRKHTRRRNAPQPAKPPAPAAPEQQAASRLPKWMNTRWVPLMALLLLVGTVLTVTMPSILYPGDRNASRMQAIHVVTKGELGIPYTDRAMLGGFLENRGQYFFENDEKERIYSKYGIGYTLLQIPPLLVIKQLSPGFSVANTPSTLMPVLNIYHILLALGAAAYLFGIAAMFTRRAWVAAAFVVASFFCSFTWSYLRASAHEILQLLPFIAGIYHATRYLRAVSMETTVYRKRGLHMLLATVFFCVVVAMKPFLAIAAMVFALCSLAAGKKGQSLAARARINVTQNLPCLLLNMAVPAIAGIGLILLFHHIRFGSALEAGYSQWKPSGIEGTYFTLKRLPIGLKGYLWSSDNRSLWHHAPLCLIGLSGLFLFLRKRDISSIYIVLTTVAGGLGICCYGTWGEWCYGPRHLMIWTIIGALPAVCTVDWLLDRAHSFIRWSLLLAMTLMLGWSFRMQCSFNGIHYFTYYYLQSTFKQFKNEDINNYFRQYRPRIHADVIEHAKGGRRMPPITIAEKRIPMQHLSNFRAQTDAMIQSLGKPNYLLFKRSPAQNRPPAR
ncbi:MAG: hypothetical protein QGH42_00770 [Kiritimatiellia bacterium]|nr:hypothetical protein [Kiritimatiellia bacterium]